MISTPITELPNETQNSSISTKNKRVMSIPAELVPNSKAIENPSGRTDVSYRCMDLDADDPCTKFFSELSLVEPPSTLVLQQTSSGIKNNNLLQCLTLYLLGLIPGTPPNDFIHFRDSNHTSSDSAHYNSESFHTSVSTSRKRCSSSSDTTNDSVQSCGITPGNGGDRRTKIEISHWPVQPSSSDDAVIKADLPNHVISGTSTCLNPSLYATELKFTSVESGKLMIPSSIRFFKSYQIRETILSQNFMLDSGADANFMDEDFAKSHQIPLVALPKPITLRLADGNVTPSGLITHHTAPIRMDLNGHTEAVSFLITKTSIPIIIGLPWLREHDPSISWSNNTIEFKSEHCRKHCCSKPVIAHGFPEIDKNDLTRTINDIDVKIISAKEFQKLAKNKENQIGVTFLREKFNFGIEFASLNYVHQQVYPFMDPNNADSVPNTTKYRNSKEDILHSDSTLEQKLGQAAKISESPQANDPFVQKYPEVFQEQLADILPEHRPYDMKINLIPGAEIPHAKIYNLSPLEEEAMKLYCETELKKGFIRRSTSPAGAPCFFVKKTDGKSLRMCVDYRALNKITVKNRFPLPLIQDLVRTLSKAKIYTALDLRGSFNLVRIAEGDEWKTAFSTRFGHYESLVMPYGLTNAPATLQNMMNDLFKDMLGIFVLIYLDDIIIFSNSPEEHEKHVESVLERLRDNKLYCRLSKCQFRTTKIVYLGYIITPDGVSMDPRKVSAIINWNHPTNVTEIQMFIGFTNFYRKFIENYSKITRPITQLLKKDAPFNWSSTVQSAFENLKQAFTKAPVLSHPDNRLPFIVETDASDFALGGVLRQRDSNGTLGTIAFYSRQLLPAEINYEIYDKELLAIFACFKEWRHFLQSEHTTTVLCDHRNLQYFMTTKELTRRQARWALFFSEFRFVIDFIPGKKNTQPDLLSRKTQYQSKGLPEYNTIQRIISPEQIVNHATFSSISLEDISASITDPDLLHAFQQDSLNYPEEVNTYLKDSNFKITEGVLTHKGYLVPISRELIKYIITSRHSALATGHLGQEKTYELVSRDYYWNGMRKDINDFIKSCECIKSKRLRHKPYGLLRQLPVPSERWKSLSVDFIPKLPNSEGYDTICVVIDRLTKLAHFAPCNETISAEQFANLFIDLVFKHHGLPDIVVSDRGPQFVSKFWRGFCKTIGIKHNLTTAYHPQTNAQVERTNATLEQYLRINMNYLQDNWVKLLPLAEFTYNNSIHSSTKMTPFFANNALHPRFDSVQISNNPTANDLTNYIESNILRLKDTLSKAQIRYARNYDSHHKDMKYNVGQFVWLSTENLNTNRPSKKFEDRRIGPFEIIERIGENAYRLKLPRNMSRIHPVFSVGLLEPVIENDFSIPYSRPPPEIIDNVEEYQVERILDSKVLNKKSKNPNSRKLLYYVKWKGYPDSENTWEEASDLANAQDAVETFHKRYPSKPSSLATLSTDFYQISTTSHSSTVLDRQAFEGGHIITNIKHQVSKPLQSPDAVNPLQLVVINMTSGTSAQQ